MFYDRFINLCKRKGVTPVQVRKDLGISQSTMASWKSRGLTPSATTLTKLADYFGVIMADLLDGNEAKIYNTGFIDGAVAESMYGQESSPGSPEKVRSDEEINTWASMFQGLCNLTEEDTQLIVSMAKQLNEARKVQQKDKTPADGD